jgi:NDP-sugar pyrophosphorylase family protein
MKAMILAAGLGTRLRPLTDDRPKALVEVGGRTLLEIALARLSSFGIGDVIVNVHHFADKIVEYLAAKRNFGMHIAISREEVLLDTGGGLKKAGYFFLQNSASAEEPFILHNVDVISTIDLRRMAQFHVENRAPPLRSGMCRLPRPGRSPRRRGRSEGCAPRTVEYRSPGAPVYPSPPRRRPPHLRRAWRRR